LNQFNLIENAYAFSASACGFATAFALHTKVHITAAIGLFVYLSFVLAEIWSFEWETLKRNSLRSVI
jgi:hypothetical protein